MYVIWKKVNANIYKSVFIILFLFQTACSTDLYQGLSEQQANKIILELNKNNIPAKKIVTDKRKQLYGIQVDKKFVAKAIEILKIANLPSSKRNGFGDLSDSGLIPSPEKQILKYYIALSEELEITLEKLPGVKMARVHIAIPPLNSNSVLSNQNIKPSRTSVILGIDEDKFKLKPTEVQTLIAGAISNISPEHIVVILQGFPKSKASSLNNQKHNFPNLFIWIILTVLAIYSILITVFFIFYKKKHSIPPETL